MADGTIVSRRSRYRAHRAQNTSSPPLTPPIATNLQTENPLPSPPAIEDPLSRSRSRYKRANAAGDATRPGTAGGGGRERGRRPEETLPAISVANTTRITPPQHSGSPLESRRIVSSDSTVSGPRGKAIEESSLQQDRYNTSRVPSPPTEKPPAHVRQTSIADLFPPPVTSPPKPVVSMNGPPTSNQIRATKSLTHLQRMADKEEDEDESAGCFSMFKRKRGEALPNAHGDRSIPPLPSKSREPQTIVPGGKGAVPGIDAPVSAVNAGDRCVLVECGTSKTIFPVTPTTNPVDIIKSASLCMSERIDARTAVLLESFGSVGVQRPLRRYEHIRDVMNSWDNDRENSLILIDFATTITTDETALSVTGAPKSKPQADQSWMMHFSQKPCKWEKRVITLRADGQLVMQKDAGSSKTKDASTNLCHLSDFDIYTPTPEKMRRKIKPPKRICYAVKSQQKTSMFESTQNFVHFFSTGDRATGDSFYAAVQGWRSWYLVHVLGEGRKPKSPIENGAMEKEIGDNGVVGNENSQQHKTGDSVGSQYQLGSFRPLLDLNNFDQENGRRPGTATSAADVSRSVSAGNNNNNPPPQFVDTTNHQQTLERRTSQAKRQHPPLSMSRGAQLGEDEPLGNLARRNSANNHQQRRRRPSFDEQQHENTGEFAANGLLGRTYSQRQREQANGYDAETNDANRLGVPRRNPSTRNNNSSNATRTADLSRHNSTSKRANHSDSSGNHSAELTRHASQHRSKPQKPLIDLTPVYVEPPQHARKGRAFRPASTEGGGGAGASGPLIDSATSPDDPLGLPAKEDWRVRGLGSPGMAPNSASVSPVGGGGGGGAGSGGVLLGRVPDSGSPAGYGSGRGHGNANLSANPGSGGTLLDMSEPEEFVPGSLLNRVERAEGRREVVVDRSRER